jgi:hypothetical protein
LRSAENLSAKPINSRLRIPGLADHDHEGTIESMELGLEPAPRGMDLCQPDAAKMVSDQMMNGEGNGDGE